jgi:hypothetical protein
MHCRVFSHNPGVFSEIARVYNSKLCFEYGSCSRTHIWRCYWANCQQSRNIDVVLWD